MSYKTRKVRISVSQSRMMIPAFLIVVMMLAAKSDGKCDFKAIFNFGDSNSDTGGFWAAFPSQSLPYGMTYFKRPVGRSSDGRLIIDFLAQALGLPFLSPYLQSIGPDYKHGVNFATVASTVLLPQSSLFVTGVSPFSLGIQLNQMKHFKAEVDQHHSLGAKYEIFDILSFLGEMVRALFASNEANDKLPQLDVFGKSLYTFYIGQNDFTGILVSSNSVNKYLPQVVSQIASTIKEIYTLGGRTFFILNLAPVGCYPSLLVKVPHDASDIDQFGCLISYNKAVIDYNDMLKEALRETRKDIHDAQVIYVDVHSIMLELFQQPTSYGLKYGTKACCGYGGSPYNFNPNVYCGSTKMIDGKNVTAGACDDPENYISWDGIHTTEAANKLVTEAILGGSYFDPPFKLHQLCDIQPIG